MPHPSGLFRSRQLAVPAATFPRIICFHRMASELRTRFAYQPAAPNVKPT